MTQKIPEQLEVVEQLPRNPTFKILKYKLRDEYNAEATEGAVMTDRLRGKVAIVTGASRGIGEAIARGLAAEGALVACVARTRNEGDKRVAGSLQATVAAIEQAGGEAVPLVADLRDLDACARVVDEARSALGPIDILVNNAAWTWFAPVAEFPVEQWLRSFAINVHAPMVLSQAVLADMIPRRSGRDHQHLVGLGARPRSWPLRNTADPARWRARTAPRRPRSSDSARDSPKSSIRTAWWSRHSHRRR